MKVSIHWLNRFSNNGISYDDQQLVDQIGEQLGAVEGVEDLKEKYKGAIIVEIVACHKLPDSDHLNVCFINDNQVIDLVDRNGDGLIQVVCGANNVKAGLRVVWLPPGSVVPSTFNDQPMTLTTKVILNTKSNGMLASSRELDITDDHAGILELDNSYTVGMGLVEAFNYNDRIIDIENKMFTHRPDLFGQLGVAREIAGIKKQPFINPWWYQPVLKTDNFDQSVINIDNQLITTACPRFMAFKLDNVTIKPSPMWFQSLLARVGLRPINNIVDITNYVMMSLAQPMHAYDLHKLDNDHGHVTISIRYAKENEQLKLLDKRNIRLTTSDIVIADQNGPIGLAGIMGGYDSQVTSTTKTVIIECANFNMYQIRRSSMHHGLFTDAVTRFNKGQSPLQLPAAINLCLELIKELIPEAKLETRIEDSTNLKLDEELTVQLGKDQLDNYLGVSLDNNYVESLLNNVLIETKFSDNHFVAKIPFWRVDLTRSEDLIEEVARLHGFNNLPLVLPERLTKPIQKPKLYSLSQSARHIMASAGSNEILTYSFTDQQLLNNCYQDKNRLFQLSNAISPKIQFYRGNILPGLLDKVHPNHKLNFREFCLFEVGKVHHVDILDEESLPKEFNRLAAIYSLDDNSSKAKYYGSAYYSAKYYLEYLLSSLHVHLDALSFRSIEAIKLNQQWQDICKVFNNNTSAAVYVNDLFVGLVGEFNSSLKQNLKLPRYCAGFELDLDYLVTVVNSRQPYRRLSSYPKIYEDITIAVNSPLDYLQVKSKLIADLQDQLPKDVELSVEGLDIYQPEKPEASRLTSFYSFRITMYSYNKTLRQADATSWLEKINKTY